MERFTLLFISYSALLLVTAIVFILSTIRRAIILTRAIHHHQMAAEAARQQKALRQSSTSSSYTSDELHRQRVEELVAHENILRGERLLYNRSVAQYNELLAGTTTGLVLRCFGFAPASLYDLE